MAASLRYALFVLVFASLVALSMANDPERKVYIVYMGSQPADEQGATNLHISMLQEVLQGSQAEESLVYSYRRSFNGFAAKLTEAESRKIADMDGVVSVFQSKKYELHTTHSWDFLGLRETAERMPAAESDVIIGFIDTGIWPLSESFNDDGLGPPPEKWKGACKFPEPFTCNNKIIGARAYGSPSPLDNMGHGTHTAATAAGGRVKGASLYGIANGTARGGVPSARIAAYNVCDPFGCMSEDVMAGLDDAIADGVDILSVSLGGYVQANFSDDVLAIGGFHAMANGVLMSNSAGNSGPTLGSTTSIAPWIMSVAATTTDRRIISNVSLGDGRHFVGNAVNNYSLNGTMFPLITGAQATNACDYELAMRCAPGCMDPSLANQKIIYCNASALSGYDAMNAGATGMIELDFMPDVAFRYFLPTTAVSDSAGAKIWSYINTTTNPEATIWKSETAFNPGAPAVGSFSSRGPSTITWDILKPDISAPGVDILAAFHADDGLENFDILSGTSMSCPHVTGAAAYVKSFHPHWSPAAIKSALMTTASPMNASKVNYGSEFAYGAGSVNPVMAARPGLIYDAFTQDYIQMLCNMGYSDKIIRKISGEKTTCPKNSTGSDRDLNYPSMAVRVPALKPFASSFPRTVTNVGSARSTYTATVHSGKSSVEVTVSPSVLKFQSLKEKQGFVVRVSGEGLTAGSIESLSLVWSDGVYRVRSPIVVYVHG